MKIPLRVPQLDIIFRIALIPATYLLLITSAIGNLSIIYNTSINKQKNKILGEAIDQNPPIISNLQPSSGEVEDKEIIITGDTEFNTMIRINGIEISSDGGFFSYIHTLKLGENTFLVEAEDISGNISSSTITITRIDPCEGNSICGECGNPECPQLSTANTSPNTACNLNFNTELMNLINEYRSQNGLVQLEMDYNLNNAACGHSQWMSATGNISHVGYNGSTPWDRCRDAGSQCDGEIITLYITQPIQALNKWKVSTPHNNNMLNPNWREIGLGMNGGYVTVVFKK
jgi:hypothetical protein